MLEYAQSMFALKAAARLCCCTSSSLTELEVELELIVDGDRNRAVDRYGLSDPRDEFAFSVDGAKVCVRSWSFANPTPAVVSTMATKMLGLVET